MSEFTPMCVGKETLRVALRMLSTRGRYMPIDSAPRDVARAILNWNGTTPGSHVNDAAVIHNFVQGSRGDATQPQPVKRPYIVSQQMLEAMQKCADYRAIPSLYAD